MKALYTLVIALLLLGCTQTADQTIDTPADVPPETPENGTEATSGDLEGTHSICEDGECRKANGCPAGYDEFMSQIGPACVQHYGKEEISTWPVCKFSNDNCSCTYVSRDTQGSQLTWNTLDEGLRCAPENYRDYMVHNGLSGVDENGEEYAMIA